MQPLLPSEIEEADKEKDDPCNRTNGNADDDTLKLFLLTYGGGIAEGE
jgi:hypothetical protein